MIYTDKINEAIHFASIAHKDQKRSVLDYPYITHPLAVLFLISQFTKDEDALVASVLHDTVEDTETTLEDIESKFGKKVRDIVDVLTEDDLIVEKKARKSNQLERFKKADHDTLLIKTADIIHNFCSIILVLKNYPKETYLEVFGGNIRGKIETAGERIKIIEEIWEGNPLLVEVKSRFEEYKKTLEKLGLLDS
jgi:(p)ppGpp synthase/HD superfamily hydrolase